ncbi:MAG: type III pantothenate kinase [Faecalibacterium sp.]
MILTINIGNTNISLSGYHEGAQQFSAKLYADPRCTASEYAVRITQILALYNVRAATIEGAIIGSVVPTLTTRLREAIDLLCTTKTLIVGPGLKSGLKLRLDNPTQLGAELLCAAVAALAEGSAPLVIINADTAISMIAVNRNNELIGGSILPGPQLSLASLVKNTAQLPQIDLHGAPVPTLLGTNSIASLQSGVILGTASLLDGMAARFCAELGADTAFYITGTLPTCIRTACTTPLRYRESLISDGLHLIWQKNQK